MKYQDINALTIDSWIEEGWQWGQPITHDIYMNTLNGEWDVYLTPTKAVPHEWFGDIKDKCILGLASGGAQQMPIFAALGAKCTLLDYSTKQCESDRQFALNEGYDITVLQEDMSKPLPFEDETFDLIFHPVSNVYVEDVKSIFKECYRVLKKGGILLSGLDTGINFMVDINQEKIVNRLPFNPLKDEKLYKESLENNDGIQFSHTLEEQIGGQLQAGFILLDLYEDTNGEGRLHELNIPSFVATKAIKK